MNRYKKWVKTQVAKLRRSWKRLVLRWRLFDLKYRWKWRVANLFAAVLILTGVAIPIAQQLWQSNRYALSADSLKLVGNTDASLAKQLTYDAQAKQYVFNKDAIATGSSAGLPAQLQKASVGAADKSNAKTYGLQVPEDFSKGVTYYDTNSQLSFSMVPDFGALSAKTEQGRIVFPIDGGNQAVYTLKNNGLKEDIIVPKVTQDTMSFSYTLDVPKTMAVKALPDGSGGIGIYSADPSLFGNISYGSDADQAAVQKARENGDKTSLVFGIPAPVIHTLDSQSTHDATARFELNGNKLTVVAENLAGITSPISIDPSVVVTSSSDFQTGGNNEGMIDFGTSGQITRGGLTGGSMGSWTSTGMEYAPSHNASVAYNGYLYSIGGDNYGTQVSRAALNSSNGSIGSFGSAGTALPINVTAEGLAVYNGYLYVMGGVDDGTGTYFSGVLYAPIDSSGLVGSWQTTASLPGNRATFASAAYNGYLYVMGGYDGSTVHNDVYYAPINANGTVGTWASTTSFTTARSSNGGFVYNGYLYVMGGYNAVSTYYSDVQYAKINSDGTVGTWTATTSFTTGRAAPSVTVYNGYAYVMGGTVDISNARNDTQYAPINANGTIGTWRTSTNLNIGVWGGATAAYNGYLYVWSGRSTGNVGDGYVQYAKIDPAGTAGSYATSGNSFTTARQGASAVAYNGYLYEIGGDAGSSPLTTHSVMYAALNSDGTLGTWSDATAFTSGNYETFGSAVAYNGSMYVVGGCNAAFASCGSSAVSQVLKATINSNGTLGTWTAQTVLTAARVGLNTVVYNNTMYVLGGASTSNTYSSAIYYHSIDPSTGNISGAWTTSARTLPAGMGFFGAVAYGGKLYVSGGCSGGTVTSCSTIRGDAYYVPIGVDSSGNGVDLTAAFTTASHMVASRTMLALTAVNGYLYAVGGRGAGYLSSTEYAPINSDGSLGTWVNSSASTLSAGRAGIGLAAANGSLYVTGGYDGSTYYNASQIAPVNNGGSGSAGAWSSATSGACGAYSGYGVAVYKGFLYTVGGDCSGDGAGTVVNYASLNADGTVGTFTSTTSLQADRGWAGIVALNGYLYALSGYTGSVDAATSEYAPINSDGTVGTWHNTTASPTARDTPGVAIYNGRIYIVGGDPTETSVQYATPGSSGDITSWSSGTTLPDDRWFSGVVAYGGYLYALGGGSGGSNSTNSVVYAPINSNGSIGSWSYTSSFNVPIFTSAVAANGFMYIIGGLASDVSTIVSTVQYAPIHANGTLGTWQYTTGLPSTPDELSSQFTATYNGYIYGLYVIGGTGKVAHAALNAISHTGRYSKLVDLGSALSVTSISYNGTVPGGAGAVTYRTAGSNGVFGASAASASLSGSSSCTASSNYIRYVLVNVTLDDSYGGGTGGGFPDASSAAANLTDFTVNYNAVHPPPQIRLRLGQTLQQGNLSSLDTCTP